jgi:GT2 family glycosyltransferase
MLFRTSALLQIGLFDERFFMYPEDIDITRRVNARFRTLFFPGATIVHDHGRDSYKNARALWVHMMNVVKYFNKWGWFHDPARSKVNRETLQQFHPGFFEESPEEAATAG